jgi:dCMP deaminase
VTRPDWDDTWWAVAQAIGARSKCERRAVGAVIVDSRNRPIAVGYNGPPRHLTEVSGTSTEEPCSVWCPRAVAARLELSPAPRKYDDCYTIHAEVNALLFADRRDYEGGTIYVTSSPCWECSKAIANSGLTCIVTEVLDEDAHRNPQASVELLRNSGLAVILRDNVLRD